MNDRRQFLRNSVAVAGVCVGASTLAPREARSAAAPARSSIGLGWIGETRDSGLLKCITGNRLINLIAACSDDARVTAKARVCAESATALLRDPAIQAVVIAGRGEDDRRTWVEQAVRAGKHVYAEVPLETAIAASGSQVAQAHLPCRSRVGLRQAIEALWSGKIGWVEQAHVVSYRSNRATIDAMDLACWGLAVSGQPLEASTVKGRINMTWKDRVLIVDECPGTKQQTVDGLREGVVFQGSKGKMVCTLKDSAIAYSGHGELWQVYKGSGDPMAEFVHAIAGKRSHGASLGDAVLASTLLKSSRQRK